MTNIIVNLQHEATHHWPDAENYLQYEHRHVFHICCKKRVTDYDREIEFIEFKNEIQSYLAREFGNNWNDISCEWMASHLVSKFDLWYCSVLEDGENGAEHYGE
jgi:hypothetical protein